MNFIEVVLGLSPDSGSGVAEFSILAAMLGVAMLVRFLRRPAKDQ